MWFKKTKTTNEHDLLDTGDEFVEFFQRINKKEFKRLQKAGYDYMNGRFHIVQPFDSGHYIVMQVGDDEERSIGFKVSYDVASYDTEKQTTFMLKSKPGFLDVFHPDYSVMRQTQLKGAIELLKKETSFI